ncbi:MAG TPA: hypothetical protein VGM10_01010 [Actinocrinis sp.]|jgi:hypothetical protein
MSMLHLESPRPAPVRDPAAKPADQPACIVELEVRPSAGPAWLGEFGYGEASGAEAGYGQQQPLPGYGHQQAPPGQGQRQALGPGSATLTVRLAAESVRFDGPQLLFLSGDDVVRSVPRADVASLTWRAPEPRRRPPNSRHPNAGALWTEPEREQLTAEVLGDLSWLEISRRHGRSVTAVRREAVKARLVDELGRRLDPPAARPVSPEES